MSREALASGFSGLGAAMNNLLYLSQIPLIYALVKEGTSDRYTFLPSLTLMVLMSGWSKLACDLSENTALSPLMPPSLPPSITTRRIYCLCHTDTCTFCGQFSWICDPFHQPPIFYRILDKY